MRQVEDQGELAEFGRLKAEAANLQPPFRAACLFAQHREKDRSQKDQRDRETQRGPALELAIIDVHRHQHG